MILLVPETEAVGVGPGNGLIRGVLTFYDVFKKINNGVAGEGQG
jgi:hypothetical protein